MLVYGTCNPEGYGDATYEGLYLTDADIRAITPQMQGESMSHALLYMSIDRHPSYMNVVVCVVISGDGSLQ